MPGIAGLAPSAGAAGPSDVFPTIGADRSFVTAFFNLAPLLMSENSAPYTRHEVSV